MSSLRKLPPEVARELRRHIAPTAKKTSSNPGGTAQQQQQQPKSSLPYVLAGCIGLTATAASFPLLATWWVGNLNEKDTPLTGSQVRRGAFNNSGSRDVGKDPNWDFSKGEYKQPTGYAAIYDEETKRKQQRLPGQFMAMPEEALGKHEEGMIAFAKGQERRRAQ